MYNLISFCGIIAFLFIAWLCSSERKRMNWRLVGWGLGLQLAFALFIFRVPAGARAFLFVNTLVNRVMEAASAGPKFVLGRLADPASTGQAGLGYLLAFQGLPAIVVVSALVSLLYYLGILPWIIRQFARLFTRLMRISGAESLCAASNIFIGVESSIAIKPHLKDMTRSELCTVLTAGMATVASNVLFLYVATLKAQFPTIAGHLVSASFLSAPAALIFSKVLVPETGSPVTLGQDIHPHYERESNLFEAVINGANSGLQLLFGIVALLIAVVGLVSLADLALGAGGGYVNGVAGWDFEWSFKNILGYVFSPVVALLGVPFEDIRAVAGIIGERLVVTEVAAYQDLATLIDKGAITPRSAVISSYALCGFAHIPSVAIFVGGVSALAPERKGDLASLAGRALLAATFACLMTACIAGVFYSGGDTVLSVAP